MEDEMRVREKYLLRSNEVENLRNGLIAKLKVV